MILRLRIASWRFTFSFAQVVDILGVNSLLKDGNHILMWDFDGVPFYNVKKALEFVQKTYTLPQIQILKTGKKDHYIAYCFKRVSWRLCKEIVACTLYVDEQFFKYGVYRDKFTLRVSPKGLRKAKLYYVLWGNIPPDVDIKELTSWVKYETLSDLSPEGKKELVIAKHE